MNNITDLAAERTIRRASSPPDVIPSETERQAWSFARNEGNEGRARAIARHPDLAKRIRDAYRFADIHQWSGYIPPRECGGRYNDSPMRRAVVEACAEAWRRESQPAKEKEEPWSRRPDSR